LEILHFRYVPSSTEFYFLRSFALIYTQLMDTFRSSLRTARTFLFSRILCPSQKRTFVPWKPPPPPQFPTHTQAAFHPLISSTNWRKHCISIRDSRVTVDPQSTFPFFCFLDFRIFFTRVFLTCEIASSFSFGCVGSLTSSSCELRRAPFRNGQGRVGTKGFRPSFPLPCALLFGRPTRRPRICTNKTPYGPFCSSPPYRYMSIFRSPKGFVGLFPPRR